MKGKKNKRSHVHSSTSELGELQNISAQLDRIENRLDSIQSTAVKSGAVAGTVAGSLSGALVATAIAIIQAKIGLFN